MNETGKPALRQGYVIASFVLSCVVKSVKLCLFKVSSRKVEKSAPIPVRPVDIEDYKTISLTVAELTQKGKLNDELINGSLSLQRLVLSDILRQRQQSMSTLSV